MKEIQPTWKIARQISRRHTLISVVITLGLLGIALITAWIVVKCLGYADGIAEVKSLLQQYQRRITSVIFLIHLFPVNLYAIIRTFRSQFKDFRVVLYRHFG